ncbi:hypothetical protein EP47_08360 [Legionella norrlandica]|uniref:F-box domain-containing protein n=1 Tax=Legionella norrlandica TaxID=1498499 RepID=A0A0A2SN52_9GAMM|nr:hypothetical protein EP47_08360 [Legionella norrlandica]
MRDKFKEFDELPAELKRETAEYLPNRDLVNFASISKHHWTLFKPRVDECKLIHQLLLHVVRGEHDKVHSMLKKDMSLIFKRGFVMDCSGREFENVSPEYALWGSG